MKREPDRAVGQGPGQGRTAEAPTAAKSPRKIGIFKSMI